jgi:hypothetical protein
MLHRIHDQSKQRIHLITGKVAGIGECAGILSFQAWLNHLLALASTNFFISADMLPI